jgi:hypothetical protein
MLLLIVWGKYSRGIRNKNGPHREPFSNDLAVEVLMART